MPPYSHQCFVGVHPTSTRMPSSDNDKAVMIAVSLLKRKNPPNIQTLKQFLTFIPNPNHIKDVLKTAVLELIYTCPSSAFWLYQHPEVLEPEIQVREIIAEELRRKLLDWGYTPDDFYFAANPILEVRDGAKANLVCPETTPADKAALTLIYALLS
jgi:hypothetical protein